MSSNPPGTGHPDGEARGMPHGTLLRTGSALTVPAGGVNLPWPTGFAEVGGYRSLVVQVKNNGPNDVTVTPRWNFYDGASAIDAEQTQTVKAGTSRRLIFQNHGDIVNRVNIGGGGGGTTVDYSVAPSNLDPLPSSAPDYLILYGVKLAVNNPPVGDEDHAKFTLATAKTNDAGLWSYVLDGAGRIKEVQTSAPGRYDLYAAFEWDAPGVAAVRTTLINVFGVGPIAMSPSWSTVSAVAEEAFLGAFTEMIAGTAQFNVQPVNGTAGALNFWCALFWIRRWAI